MHKNLGRLQSDRQNRGYGCDWYDKTKIWKHRSVSSAEGTNWFTYNKTSNVHQTNKKVQGHDKQNQIKMPVKEKLEPLKM